MAAAAPAPIAFSVDHVAIRGGMLKSRKCIAIPVKRVGDKAFWVINTHDEYVSEVLTGIAACHRPLCGIEVFKDLREKLLAARKAQGTGEQKDQDEEEAFNFAGEVIEEMVETPQKKKAKRVKAQRQRFHVLDVDMPLHFGVDDPRFSVTLLNSAKELAVLVDEQTLTWLVKYVHDERSAG